MCSRRKSSEPLTPADTLVDAEVIPLCQDCDDQKAVQVDALHQQPVVVGQYAVLHHHHCNPTADRRLKRTRCVWITESFRLNFNLLPPFRFIFTVNRYLTHIYTNMHFNEYPWSFTTYCKVYEQHISIKSLKKNAFFFFMKTSIKMFVALKA